VSLELRLAVIASAIDRTLVLAMGGLVATLASGCATPGAITGQHCDTSFAALSAATDDLVDRDNARDLEGVLAGYTEDITWLPPAGKPLTGKDAIRSRYQDLFSKNQINLRSQTAEAFAQDQVGFVRGTTTGTLTPLTGETVIQVQDKFMAIVRCQSGVWRVSHLMWSPLGPAASP